MNTSSKKGLVIGAMALMAASLGISAAANADPQSGLPTGQVGTQIKSISPNIKSVQLKSKLLKSNQIKGLQFKSTQIKSTQLKNTSN